MGHRGAQMISLLFFEKEDAMQKELSLAREIYIQEYPPEHDIFVFMRSYFSPKGSR